MKPAPERAQWPEELARLTKNPRILVRGSGAPRTPARCVVYWMQRAMRVLDNPALDVAIEAGNLLGLPVVIYFGVVPNYPNANLRHYHFLAQGLRDVEADAAELGVEFVVRRPPDNRLDAFLEEVQAALLVGDENPCREPERWRKVLAQRLKFPYWTVDADVVVPSRVFNRSFALLHHFRSHLKRELPKFLVVPKKIKPLHPWKPHETLAHFNLAHDITTGFSKLDRSIKPVDTFTGGTHAALRRLGEFIRRDLAAYNTDRNHPEKQGTSRLSPYLHFGNIGPLTIALAVRKAAEAGKIASAISERFLEQLIGWRELAVLFVRHEPNYDNWECAAPWARQSLLEHAADTRPFRYALAQLERGETHDELWNAAQRQMVTTGWMHNFMRIYWAKKILEWAPDPATAFDWAVILNDRYELDGRDPNGYAGIAWAIVGKLDRPWFNRSVFGLVRSMTAASFGKKFDSDAYIRQYPAEKR
ncbi:MAG TPA: deoxyribodipyrimidine photo-lyase [Terracidiphilus sp.]|nr:deoxyribodipyrimidine photo-lyase [Terracidiphilus sp.]